MQRLTVKTGNIAALTIRREATNREQLVYVALANKPIKYKFERSRIVYIGTTRKGADRIAKSAADKARELLSIHGVKELDFWIISCAPRQGVKTWRKLERALLLKFRSMHGDVPKANNHGIGMKEMDVWNYFSERRIGSILKKYSPKKTQ